MIIENVERGKSMVGVPGENNRNAAYDVVKIRLRKTLNLVWLGQFGEGRYTLT